MIEVIDLINHLIILSKKINHLIIITTQKSYTFLIKAICFVGRSQNKIPKKVREFTPKGKN